MARIPNRQPLENYLTSDQESMTYLNRSTPTTTATKVYSYDGIDGVPLQLDVDHVNFLSYRKAARHWWTNVNYAIGVSDRTYTDVGGDTYVTGHAYPLGFPNNHTEVDVLLHSLSPNVDFLGVSFRYQADTDGQVSVQVFSLSDLNNALEVGWEAHIPDMDGNSGLQLTGTTDVYGSKGAGDGIRWLHTYRTRVSRSDDPSDIETTLPYITFLNVTQAMREATLPIVVRFTTNTSVRIISAHVFEVPYKLRAGNSQDPFVNNLGTTFISETS